MDLNLGQKFCVDTKIKIRLKSCKGHIMEELSQVNPKPRVVTKDELDANMNETHFSGSGSAGNDVHVQCEDTVLKSTCGNEAKQIEDESKPALTEIESKDDRVGEESSNVTREIIAESNKLMHTVKSQPVHEFEPDRKSAAETSAHSESAEVNSESEAIQNASLISNLEISIKSEDTAEMTGLSSPVEGGPTVSPIPSTFRVTSQNPVSSGKRRRRGSAWTDDETEYLLEIWAKQTEIMKEKGSEESVTSAPVYRLISRSLAEFGWEKSWEQCKTRIHTLKRAYKITKDEIDGGSQTVTYCRHFDKLEIIMGDNPTTTPGMLALTLEQKRKQRGEHVRGRKLPVRRKLTVGDNPNLIKRSKTNNFESFVNGADSQVQAASSFPGVTKIAQNNSSNTTWFSQNTQPQAFQQPLSASVSSVQQNIPANFAQPSLPPAPQYLYSTATSVGTVAPPPPYSSVVETNNNKVNVKTERDENSQSFTIPYTTSSGGSALQAALSQPVGNGNELERMRLDLEMRKLEVERNKIEMEERQRREDRDHQYRMLQLLLFGLGQQNISQLLSGQGGTDMTHAHSTDILRALENGLVPGGPQKANEKGLSFSEL